MRLGPMRLEPSALEPPAERSKAATLARMTLMSSDWETKASAPASKARSSLPNSSEPVSRMQGRRAQGRVQADAAQQFRPVHARQLAVDDQEIRPEVGGQAQALLAAFRLGHVIARALQGVSQGVAEAGAVVNDQGQGLLPGARIAAPQQFPARDTTWLLL